MNDKIKWSKEFVYYLGFLWADGSVYRNGIRLELIESDSIELIDYFNKIDFIKFNTYKRMRKGCNPQMSIYFCNSKIYDKFFSLYFKDKSTLSPKELLKAIPSEFVNYFYLGLIDGDGCFYISKDKKSTQFSISSSYQQDWTHIEDLFYLLDIKKYGINRRINKQNTNSQSSIRITNYNDILKLSNYLYPNGYELGLKRKYNKCKLIIDNIPKYTINNETIMYDELISKITELKVIKEVSKYFNCSYKKIFNHCKKYNIDKDGFTQNKRLKYEEYMTYDESKIFISKLNLKSKKEWVTFCKEGKRPNNIPSNPFLFYKNSGWVSYMDWLGYK
jgi:hypothetical protein